MAQNDLGNALSYVVILLGRSGSGTSSSPMRSLGLRLWQAWPSAALRPIFIIMMSAGIENFEAALGGAD